MAIHVYVPWYTCTTYVRGTMVRTYVAYMLADLVVAIPAVDLAIEAVV